MRDAMIQRRTGRFVTCDGKQNKERGEFVAGKLLAIDLGVYEC